MKCLYCLFRFKWTEAIKHFQALGVVNLIIVGWSDSPEISPSEEGQAPRSVWKALAFTYKMFFWCAVRSAPPLRFAQYTARESSITLSISAFALGNHMLGVSVVGSEER